MTREDYIKQNAKGFEGDTFLKEMIQNLCQENNIELIIETGTYYGATTKHLAKMAPAVHTVEVIDENFKKAKQVLKGFKNVTMHKGNSADIIKDLLPKKEDNISLFCFLDAHWESYNPLIDELKAIAQSGCRPIIAIHDFKVPDHPELGFDTYKGIVYEWDWIKSSIESIYGPEGYEVSYNSEATGAKRGVIFIKPKSEE